jgi:hypothetical protein
MSLRPMTIFRFRRCRSIPAFEVLDFHDIDEAMAHADALIVRYGYTHVEIDDAGKTIRVERRE